MGRPFYPSPAWILKLTAEILTSVGGDANKVWASLGNDCACRARFTKVLKNRSFSNLPRKAKGPKPRSVSLYSPACPGT